MYFFYTTFGGGAAVYSKGKLTITENTQIINNGIYGGGYFLVGAAICSKKELHINGNAIIANDTAQISASAIAASGIVRIGGNARIFGNSSDEKATIYLKNADFVLGDSAQVTENLCYQNGGGIYAENSTLTLQNKAVIGGNIGGGIFMIGSNLNIKDSAVIALNRANENYGAGIYNKGGNINLSGGQIIGNYFYYDSLAGKGMAIYNDTIATKPAPIVHIANARIFNPTQTVKRTIEVFNEDGVLFSSDSTWWGESDTTGLIVNNGTASCSLSSWVVADWAINKGWPIVYDTTFDIDAYFRLNSGAPIPPNMFWMLRGLYAATYGTFSPDTAAMLPTNFISSNYTSGDSTRLVNMVATVDADTLKHTQILIGLSIRDIENKIGSKMLSIFPNPTKEVINIKSEQNIEEAIVEIRSILGKVVLTKKVKFENNQSMLKLNLANGFYLIRIKDTEGNVYNGKLELE